MDGVLFKDFFINNNSLYGFVLTNTTVSVKYDMILMHLNLACCNGLRMRSTCSVMNQSVTG